MADYLVACSNLAITVGGKIRALHLGDSITGNGEPFISLERAGFLTQGTLQEVDATPADKVPAPAGDKPGEVVDEKPQDGEADEPAPEPVDVKPGEIERPKQAGTTEEWRKYAESLGIKAAGMSKKDLIAATR